MDAAAPRKTRAKRKNPKHVLAKQNHGPAATKEATWRLRKTEEIAERRKKAWRIYLDERIPLSEVGKRCGVSGYTAWHDIVAYYEALPKDNVEVVRARQQHVIDRLLRAHLPQATQKASADVVLAALEREARLYGLDRRDAGFTADQVRSLLQGIVADLLAVITDAALRQRVVEAFRKRIGTVPEAAAR